MSIQEDSTSLVPAWNVSVLITLSTGERLEIQEHHITRDSLSLVLESVYELYESYLDHADIMNLPELPAIRQRIIVKRTMISPSLVRYLTDDEVHPQSPTSVIGSI